MTKTYGLDANQDQVPADQKLITISITRDPLEIKVTKKQLEDEIATLNEQITNLTAVKAEKEADLAAIQTQIGL